MRGEGQLEQNQGGTGEMSSIPLRSFLAFVSKQPELSIACLLRASCDRLTPNSLAIVNFLRPAKRETLLFLQQNGCEPTRGRRGHCDFAMRALLTECFRGRHRRGRNFTSFFGSPNPFFSCSKMSLSYLKTCTPMKGTP